MEEKTILILLSVMIIASSFSVLAEEITVYNSTNFTKPANLTSPINITASNDTVDLPTRDYPSRYDNSNNISKDVNATLLFQLPPEFLNGSLNNRSKFLLNFTNNTSNVTKSFMDTLDENPPLKYGFIIFIVIIIIVVAYIVYLNYGEGGGGAITFDGEFSPTGSI